MNCLSENIMIYYIAVTYFIVSMYLGYFFYIFLQHEPGDHSSGYNFKKVQKKHLLGTDKGH